jgi:hypothetical protein
VTTSGFEQLTGVSDTVFNLGSVFYHAAEGGQVYAKYIEDAEREVRPQEEAVPPCYGARALVIGFWPFR